MTVIDFHSHILPNIDDGSSSVTESVAMLRESAAQGITHVVATPHFYPRHDHPQRFLERRAKAEALLRERMAKTEGLPQVTVGAEVHYFSGISQSDVVPLLTIGGGRFLLVEMPMPPWSDNMYRELTLLSEQRGITPIIAHVDRYIHPLRTHGIPKKLAELPVLVQANGDFFLNKFTSLLALRMLAADQIHLLGSDAHNMTDRMPNLGSALEVIARRLGRDAVKRINLWEREVFPTRSIM